MKLAQLFCNFDKRKRVPYSCRSYKTSFMHNNLHSTCMCYLGKRFLKQPKINLSPFCSLNIYMFSD